MMRVDARSLSLVVGSDSGLVQFNVGNGMAGDARHGVYQASNNIASGPSELSARRAHREAYDFKFSHMAAFGPFEKCVGRSLR